MADGLYIVTGGGTGIGASIAKVLAERGRVLIVGRRLEPLVATSQANPERIRTVVADLSSPEGRTAVVNAVKDEKVAALIHSAGRLDPVGPLAKVDESEWVKSMEINVNAPLFLTKALLDRLEGGGRVLHISSGAAHSVIKGWGAYCTSKAALNMIYRVLAEELAPKGIFVGSLLPGLVDTPMQAQVLTYSEADFPGLETFRGYKNDGKLFSPDEVAKFVDWTLHDTDDEEFSSKEWNIYDADDKKRWKK